MHISQHHYTKQATSHNKARHWTVAFGADQCLRRYVKNREMRNILFFILFIPNVVFSHECEKWEYSELTYLTVLKYKDESVVGVNSTITWFSPASSASWQNDKVLTGNVKKPLTEFFGTPNVDSNAITNAIGNWGWEAYAYQRTMLSEIETLNIWAFKRCAKN